MSTDWSDYNNRHERHNTEIEVTLIFFTTLIFIALFVTFCRIESRRRRRFYQLGAVITPPQTATISPGISAVPTSAQTMGYPSGHVINYAASTNSPAMAPQPGWSTTNQYQMSQPQLQPNPTAPPPPYNEVVRESNTYKM